MDEDVKIMQGQACAGRSDETEVARSLVRSPRPLCAALDTALSEQVSFSAYGGNSLESLEPVMPSKTQQQRYCK
jgi:hypothetical protein